MVTLSSYLIWQLINFILPPNEYSCVYASLSGPAIDLQKMPLLGKKIISSDGAYFDLGGYVNKQNCRIWDTEIPHAYIEKPTHPKRVTVWCRIWCRGIIRPFFFENGQEEAVTVNGDRYRALLNEFWKLKRRIRVTQPKLHLMFCALFLKIELSAAKLMSLDPFGAEIWHRWTIICGVPTRQRQLTL